MLIRRTDARGRRRGRNGRVAGAALILLLSACESGRIAQPPALPAPADGAAAAAATLGLQRGTLAGPDASLAARVDGWNSPAVPVAAPAAPRLDPRAAAVVAARAERLEGQIRARAAAGNDTAP